MLRTYLKIAWRNLVKHKLYSFINISGLSVGLGACMLILLFVAHEHSYDRFHKDPEQLYSVYGRIAIGGDTVQFPQMTYPTGPRVLQSDPSVSSFLRMHSPNQDRVVSNPLSPTLKFTEKDFLFADSNFFSFFSFRLQQGNPGQVLSRPFTMVITEEAAKKYFGNADPIGKTLRYDSAYSFEITGIAAKAPSNSSIRYDFVASLSSRLAMKEGGAMRKEQNVAYGEYLTYFRLKEGAKASSVEKTLLQLSHQTPAGESIPARYCLNPLKNTHLNMNFGDPANTTYLGVFPLVAGLILLLALINYMNLATARATLRAKEVGVRKASGASRAKIAQQFYIESALFAIIAFLCGYLLFRIAQPYFYRLMDLSIDASFIYQPMVLISFAGLLLVTIFIAGTYPSLVLSAYNPVAVLYGRMSRQKGGLALRRFLTVLQFSVSIVLIVCSLLIARQLYFFRHTDTGVNRENVLMVTFSNTLRDHYQAFKKEVGNLSGISGTATAHYALYHGYDMTEINREGVEKKLQLVTLTVDDQFIPLLQIPWKIKPAEPTIYAQDHRVVLNETAVRELRLSGDVIRQQLRIGGDVPYSVTGVLKDFTYNSLHRKVDPVGLLIQKDTSINWGASTNGCLFARIRPGVNIPTMISEIKNIYGRYDVNTPFQFQFMDEAFNDRYKAEDRLAGILGMFTGLTILIACLGLFGLAAFTASRMVREIGIRKVLGASVTSLVVLQTRSFIQWVMLSIVIAVPVAWYVMHKWLENFAYKISIGWSVFLLSGLSALLIAALTVSIESIRSSLANPAKNLRSE